MLGRVAGLTAHVYEEQTEFKPMRKLFDVEAEYEYIRSRLDTWYKCLTGNVTYELIWSRFMEQYHQYKLKCDEFMGLVDPELFYSVPVITTDKYERILIDGIKNTCDNKVVFDIASCKYIHNTSNNQFR